MEKYTQYLACISHSSVSFSDLEESERIGGDSKGEETQNLQHHKVKEISVVHAHLPPIKGLRLHGPIIVSHPFWFDFGLC